MFGLSPYLLGGVAAAFIAVLGFAGCEHHNAKIARMERDTALATNAGNLVTVDALKRSLAKWQRECKPADIYIDLQKKQLEAEAKIANLTKQNLALRKADETLPQCVELLRISLTKRCPNISAGLLKLAGQDDIGGDSSPRRETDSR